MQQKYRAQKNHEKLQLRLHTKAKVHWKKAVKKVESVLPKSPRKRSKVVKQDNLTDHNVHHRSR